MKFLLRFPLLVLLLAFSLPARSSSVDDNLPDAQALAQLELRAQQAGPRDQCFLYTELVHSMTELAGKQMLQGDTDHASVTLKKIEHYAHLIHMNLAADAKRLDEALKSRNTEDLIAQYIARLQSEVGVSINATALNQVTGGGTQN